MQQDEFDKVRLAHARDFITDNAAQTYSLPSFVKALSSNDSEKISRSSDEVESVLLSVSSALNIIATAQESRETERTDVSSALSLLSSTTTMCGYEPDSTAVRQILADPTFPPSISFAGCKRKKYLRADVEAWIERHFTEQSNALVRALKA